jgi:hypothetical protein
MPDAQYPYITLGPDSEVEDLSECIDGSDWMLHVHIWTRGKGFAATKKIASLVRRILHDAELPMENHRVIAITRRGTLYQRDPDGISRHGICRFRALTEPKN